MTSSKIKIAPTRSHSARSPAKKPSAGASGERRAASGRERAKKLSYLEQREWDTMEAAILAGEDRLERAKRAVEDPVIATDAGALQQRFAELSAAQAEVDRLYARWTELEGKVGGAES